jgi:glycosyltransferase involved in cell wall biosynthesis
VTPLRFGFLTTFYPPYSFGGDAIDVERMARALVARGHQVTVVHDRDAFRALAGQREPTTAPRTGTGVEVIGLESPLRTLSPLLTQQLGRPIAHGRRLREIFDAGAFDVVAFHNVSLVGGPGALSLGGDAVRVYVAHEHWLVCQSHVLWRHNREACDRRECLRCVLHFHRPPQLWRATDYLDRQLAHVDAFIARSAFSRDKHREFGFTRPMEVLPIFVPDESTEATMPPADAVPADSPHDRPYFLFVGRLERIKGLDTVLPAFMGPGNTDLLIVGVGQEESALRAQASGHPRIRFVGAVANRELARYYRHAVALIAPSVGFETFGIVLVEAFRQSTPVIARRHGPFPEIVEQSGGGELFGTNDELTAAMGRLTSDAGYRDLLGRRGFDASGRLWSESVVIDSFLSIVRRAAGLRAGRLGVAPPAWAI